MLEFGIAYILHIYIYIIFFIYCIYKGCFDFVPETYVLPNNFDDFLKCYQRSRCNWILKPNASSCVRGIFILKDLFELPLDETVADSGYIEDLQVPCSCDSDLEGSKVPAFLTRLCWGQWSRVRLLKLLSERRLRTVSGACKRLELEIVNMELQNENENDGLFNDGFFKGM